MVVLNIERLRLLVDLQRETLGRRVRQGRAATPPVGRNRTIFARFHAGSNIRERILTTEAKVNSPNVNHPRVVQNFGRNVRFQPRFVYEPKNETELIEILDRHAGQEIRAIGSLHSWSDLPTTDSVVIRTHNLSQVLLETEIDIQDAGVHRASVGGGCSIKSLLKRLAIHDLTMPSLGLITEQSIAGAISTGTHGSGRASLSNYIDAVRIATYDRETGRAILKRVDSGNELLAARCSLGAMGVIVSVEFRCRERYRIEEHWSYQRTLDEVLASEHQYPLQQFFLVPWKWTYFVQKRRESTQSRAPLAPLYKVYRFVCLDVMMHLLILAGVRVLRSDRVVRWMFRSLLPRFVIRNWRVIDDSSELLVMEHELFRHIETELFVPRRHLAEAIEWLRDTLAYAAGGDTDPSPGLQRAAEQAELKSHLSGLSGQYCHHYPICIRRVLRDEALISMASGGEEDWYAVSLISYTAPARREGFRRTASFLVSLLGRRLGVRPHWGKWCPDSHQEIAQLYPRLREFRDLCWRDDPQGVFSNAGLRKLFSF